MDATTFDPSEESRYRERLATILSRKGHYPGRHVGNVAPDAPEFRTLMDGRSGSRVTRVCGGAGGASVIVKTVRRRRGLSEGMENVEGGEGPLHLAGAAALLPLPLEWPIIESAYDGECDEWWLVMRDVSAGIVPRDGWRLAHSRQLLAGLARLHARCWGRDDELDRLKLPTLRQTTRACAEFVRMLVSGRAPSESWLALLLDEVPYIAPLQQLFLDSIPPADADLFRRIVHDWETPVALLERETSTFLHGDVQRANVAFEADRILLFDWEYAARGPAAVDLQNHWFFQYWASPPRHVGEDAAWEDQRDDYLYHLETALGRRLDRAGFAKACDAAWMREFIQLGFCLVEPLTDPSAGPHERERVAETCRRAFAHARRIQDRW